MDEPGKLPKASPDASDSPSFLSSVQRTATAFVPLQEANGCVNCAVSVSTNVNNHARRTKAMTSDAKALAKARVEPVPNGHGYIVTLPNDGPTLFQSGSEWECDMWLDEQRAKAVSP